MMISRAPSVAAGGERRLQHARVACGALARPVRPVPGAAAGPRPGTPRPPVGRHAGAASATSGRAEYNWWGDGARQAAAAAAAPRRQRSSRHGTGRPAALARVPTGKGNRELVRRALTPHAARVRGRGSPVLMRRWSFRPAPSRLRNTSSLPSPSPASPRPRPL